MGPFLEQPDRDVFKAVHSLVLRQERLARNRLAIDSYWTYVKLGHGAYWKLQKIQDKSEWRCLPAPGIDLLPAQSVPNKAWDLCNKTVETLMQDPPQPNPQAENDSEEAERGAEMAETFLEMDGGESGSRDAHTFWQSLDAATTKSAAFHHYWTDKQGGGYVPLQIKAHPTAVDPKNPTIGADGSETTDLILRYVITDESGEPVQFTDDPSQAPPQWLPKIRIDKWGREHIRTYPETADVGDAEMVIGLWYSTLGEMKRRWPETVGQMDDATLGALCDWTPPRYMVLLPPALRARWKLADGDPGKDQRGSTNDERLMFYYVVHRVCGPVYPKGCTVYVSGYQDGTILHRETLTAEVENAKGGKSVRCLDIPVVQVGLVADAEEKDPLDRPLIERFGGSAMQQEKMIVAYEDAIDQLLHPASFTTSVSPVEADDIDESRATGVPVPVLTGADMPQWEQPRPMPPNFFEAVKYKEEQMNSISGLTKPAQGADDQQEVSGVARRVAVNQALVALSRMQQRMNASWERHYRIKLQLALKDFSAPVLLRYTGEDGAFKQEWFSGVDFAGVTDVAIRPGSGTMMPPQDKVNYLGSLTQMGMMGQDEANKAARPAFTKALGIPADPHQQRIERQVSAWLKGPPKQQPNQPAWLDTARAYNQEKAQVDAQNAQVQADYQQHVAELQASTPQPAPGQKGPQIAPATPVLPPQPQLLQPQQPPPWTPFNPLPCDDEPLIAARRMERLSTLMAGARFEAQPPEWQQMVFNEYNVMRQAVAASQMPQLPHGVTIAMKGDQSSVAQEEQAASHPPPQQQQAA